MLRIGIVAGEVSGDQLAADLVLSLKQHIPDLQITGIGGRCLENAGCEILFPVEKLAVMGISEVFSRFFQILSIRRKIRDYYLEHPPDVFIGVDAPDFNFPLEKQLRQAGIKTIHYVSPSIWAWREYRLKSIARSVNKLLTLYPFEIPYYEKYDIPAEFVGHPLASKIPLSTNRKAARIRLELPLKKKIIAIFPGSRRGELERLVEPFLDSLEFCRQNDPSLCFITNLADEDACAYIRKQAESRTPAVSIRYFTAKSLDVMEAADLILLASGTAALEAMLMKRPMVVAYKVNWLTYQIARHMIRLPYVSLPNVIAGRLVVPEFLQMDCVSEKIAPELMSWLTNEEKVNRQVELFEHLHQQIRADSETLLTKAVLDVVNAGN